METVILQGKSKADLELLIALAKKLGIKGRRVTTEELEDIGLAKAIKEGRTGEFVDKEAFLEKLK